MDQSRFLLLRRAGVMALLVMILMPTGAFAQRRWERVRSERSRIVIYQPRPYVIYRRQPTYSYRTYTYGYPQSDYSGYYSQPYYSTRYYSYRSSQPYFANRYAYSWANPTYRYYDNGYTRRHRHNGLRIRFGWR